MDLLDAIQKNPRYKAIIDSLSTETLEIIANDHQRALEKARKGIQQEEPEKVDDVEYLEDMASAMQKIAQAELKNRSKSQAKEH